MAPSWVKLQNASSLGDSDSTTMLRRKLSKNLRLRRQDRHLRRTLLLCHRLTVKGPLVVLDRSRAERDRDARLTVIRNSGGVGDVEHVVKVPTKLIIQLGAPQTNSIIEGTQRNGILIENRMVHLVLRGLDRLDGASEISPRELVEAEHVAVADDDDLSVSERVRIDLVLRQRLDDGRLLLGTDLLDDLVLVLLEGPLRDPVCRSERSRLLGRDLVAEQDRRDRGDPGADRRNIVHPDETDLGRQRELLGRRAALLVLSPEHRVRLIEGPDRLDRPSTSQNRGRDGSDNAHPGEDGCRVVGDGLLGRLENIKLHDSIYQLSE